MYSAVLWKTEFKNDETGHSAEEISKGSVEDTNGFLLAAYSKMRKKRNKLRKELLNK